MGPKLIGPETKDLWKDGNGGVAGAVHQAKSRAHSAVIISLQLMKAAPSSKPLPLPPVKTQREKRSRQIYATAAHPANCDEEKTASRLMP